MAKTIKLKTSKNLASVSAFIKSIESDQLRKDCKTLLKLFKEVTGLKAKMWGTSIVGFGEYTYSRTNGDQGTFMATGFSPRKSGPTLYIMPGYKLNGPLLKNLGPHKLGKSCLYLKSLDVIDLKVLADLIQSSMKELKQHHKTSY